MCVVLTELKDGIVTVGVVCGADRTERPWHESSASAVALCKPKCCHQCFERLLYRCASLNAVTTAANIC
jgi:hypothetical protein